MHAGDIFESPHSIGFAKLFTPIWKDEAKLQNIANEIIGNTTATYQENFPVFIYFLTLLDIFNEFLEDIFKDIFPNDMRKYSKLLNDTIRSSISIKEEYDIECLFCAGGTAALRSNISR